MAELGVSLCFFHRQNRACSNINADPIKWTPLTFLLLISFPLTFFTFILEPRFILCISLIWGVSRILIRPLPSLQRPTKLNTQVQRPVVHYGQEEIWTHFPLINVHFKFWHCLQEKLLVGMFLVFFTLMVFPESYVPFYYYILNQTSYGWFFSHHAVS